MIRCTVRNEPHKSRLIIIYMEPCPDPVLFFIRDYPEKKMKGFFFNFSVMLSVNEKLCTFIYGSNKQEYSEKT
jgi:hypothetical protein